MEMVLHTAELKCVLVDCGVQSVVISGTMKMQQLHVNSLVSLHMVRKSVFNH